MNSPFAKAFLAIQNRLTDQVPALQYVDQDLGQLQGYTNRPGVKFPCALIDFPPFKFDNVGDLMQMADGTVIINLGFALHSATNNLTPAQWREVPLKYYEIEWAIHKALQGWSPGDEFGYLTRSSSSGKNTPMGVRVRPLVYRLTFEDSSATFDFENVAKPDAEFTTAIEDTRGE